MRVEPLVMVFSLLTASCETEPNSVEPPIVEPPISVAAVSWSAIDSLSGPSAEEVRIRDAAVTSGGVVVVGEGSLPQGVHGDIWLTRHTGATWEPFQNVSQSADPSSRPLVAAAPDGSVHLVWGDRVGTPTPRPFGPPTALRHRSLFPLSVVTTLAARDWELQPPKEIAITSGGEPVVAFSEPNDSGTRAIRTAQLVQGSWVLRDGLDEAFDPSLLVSGARWVVAFLAPDRSTAADVNSVFVVGSKDNGASWVDTILVSRSGLRPAQLPRLVSSPTGTLWLFWLRDGNGDVFPDELWWSMSVDGQGWQPPALLEGSVAEPITGFDAVVVGARKLAVAFHTSSQAFPPRPPLRLWVKLFDEQGWSEKAVVFNDVDIGLGFALWSSGDEQLGVATKILSFDESTTQLVAREGTITWN